MITDKFPRNGYLSHDIVDKLVVRICKIPFLWFRRWHVMYIISFPLWRVLWRCWSWRNHEGTRTDQDITDLCFMFVAFGDMHVRMVIYIYNHVHLRYISKCIESNVIAQGPWNNDRKKVLETLAGQWQIVKKELDYAASNLYNLSINSIK